MWSSALKGLGVVVLVGAFVGVLAGALMIMVGGTGSAETGDAPGRAAALVGSSLMAAGLGIVLLLAGILLRNRRAAQVGPLAPPETRS